MSIFSLFTIAVQRLVARSGIRSLWQSRLTMFQVIVPLNRNYLGRERVLHELYLRAKDVEEAERMLAQFKERFPYPNYLTPEKMPWPLAAQISLPFPQIHNVIWRVERQSGDYHFRSFNIVDLDKVTP